MCKSLRPKPEKNYGEKKKTQISCEACSIHGSEDSKCKRWQSSPNWHLGSNNPIKIPTNSYLIKFKMILGKEG